MGDAALQQRRTSVLGGSSLGLALALGVCAAAAGEPQASPAGAPQAAAAPDVPLDRLFKIPSSVAAPALEPRRGGKTRAEWQARFQQAQADLDKARTALEDSRKQMEAIAPDNGWSMSAPGLPVDPQPSEKSVDFKLRQQIRRQREDVEHAERRQQELAIEANLAEVPEEWRHAADASEAKGKAPAAPPAPSAEPEGERSSSH